MQHLAIPCCLTLVTSLACGDDTSGSTGSDASSDAQATLDAQQEASAEAGEALDAALDATTTPIAQANFATAFAEAFCQAAKPCCDASSTYKPGCVASVTSEVEEMLASLGERRVYDEVQAERCVSALKSVPRDCVDAFETRNDFRSSCQLALNGTLQPGEECEMLADCAAQPGAIGNRQFGYVGCLDFEDETTRCRHFEPVGLDDPCSDTVIGGTESVVASCTPELFCDPEAFTCRPLPENGEPCMRVGNSGPCAEGFCDQDTDTCTALRTVGQDCPNSLSCDPCGGEQSCETRYQCDEDVCREDDLIRFFSVAFGHIKSVFVSHACDLP